MLTSEIAVEASERQETHPLLEETQDTSASLSADFHDAQVIELLGEHWQGTLLEREGLGTNALQRRHIGTGSSGDRSSVRVLKAQMHGAHDLGGILYK